MTEQSTYNAQKLADSGAYASMDDLNAALSRIIKSGRPVPDQAPDSPLEAAQLLIYKTIGAKTPEERRRLAEEALALSGDCADAHRILAEYELEPDVKRRLLEDAIAAGRRAWEASDQDTSDDSPWGYIEIRPMLRAMATLGMFLRSQGDIDDAIAVFSDMIEISPKDNQGIRSVLAPLLLAQGDIVGFQKLDSVFGHEGQADWAYSRALRAFRESGPASSQALKELRLGLSQNPVVPKYMLGARPIPDRLPMAFEPGGEDEAVLYLDRAGALWRDTPGALEWLAEHALKAELAMVGAVGDRGDALGPPPYSFPSLWRWISLRLPAEGSAPLIQEKLSRRERQLENQLLIRIRGMKSLDRLAAMVDRLNTHAAHQAWRERLIKYGATAAPVILSLLGPAQGEKRVSSKSDFHLLALAPHLGPQFCPELARIFDTLSDPVQALACVVFGRLAYQPGLALARRCYARLYADYSAAEEQRETRYRQGHANSDQLWFIGPVWAMIDLGDPQCDEVLQEIAGDIAASGELYGFAVRAGGPKTLEALLDKLEEAIHTPRYQDEASDALVCVASLATRLNDHSADAQIRDLIGQVLPSETLETLDVAGPVHFERFFS